VGHRLPQIAGRLVIKVFEEFEWSVDRIKGSHHIMTKEGEKPTLSIPVHGNKPISPGTLKSLIKDANLTQEDFFKAYFNL
jgi:predicted RNA binding protein YcfA (HicA-like mRNA interferase family)